MQDKRKAYEEKFDAQLKEWNGLVALLKTEAEDAKAGATINYCRTIEALEHKQAEAKIRLQELKTAGDEAWEAVKADVEKARADVITAYHDAASMFKGATKKKTKKSESSDAGQALSGRILVSDDDKTFQDVVSSFLEFMGFEVALACNGIEALAVFLKSSFDLVLTDLQMPAMDGLSLAGHIKERSPRTPVILLTGSNTKAVRRKVERGPVDSVIFKPFKLEHLQRTIQGALASGEQEQGSVEVGQRLGASPKEGVL